MVARTWPPHADPARPESIPGPDAPRASLYLIVLIAAVVVLGGGTRQGLWSDAILQISALVLIAGLFWSVPAGSILPSDRLLRIVIAGMFFLPLTQIVDLPPALWSRLPGRDAFALAYDEAGVARPWLPISLDPARTLRAWLALLPAIAVFVATVRLDIAGRRKVSLVLVGLGLLSVILGLTQLVQGPASGLRFYPITNDADAVGFFANRNHQAIFLVCLIPLTAAWTVHFVLDRRGNRILALALCLIVYAALLLGIGIARSRAGVALAGAVSLAGLAMAATGDRGGSRRNQFVLGSATAFGVLLVVHFSFFQIAQRFEVDLFADARFTLASVTFGAVWEYFPFGAGVGTFEAVYRIFEPISALIPPYANHAHNDWLELLLEGGLAALVLLIVFLAWLGLRLRAISRLSPDHGLLLDRHLSWAGAIAVLVLLLHSTVEYPLRTTALSSVFAFSLGLLVPPVGSARTMPGAGRGDAPRRGTLHRQRHRRRHAGD